MPPQEAGWSSRHRIHLDHDPSQRLKDAGHAGALPEKIWRIVRSLSADGRSEDGGAGSLDLRRLDPDLVHVTLQREWSALTKTAQTALIDELRLAAPELEKGERSFLHLRHLRVSQRCAVWIPVFTGMTRIVTPTAPAARSLRQRSFLAMTASCLLAMTAAGQKARPDPVHELLPDKESRGDAGV